MVQGSRMWVCISDFRGEARARGNLRRRSSGKSVPSSREFDAATRGAVMVKRYSLGLVSLILEFIRRSLGVASTIQLQVMPPRAATREPAECDGCAQAHRSPSVLAAVRFQALRCRGPPAEQPICFV